MLLQVLILENKEPSKHEKDPSNLPIHKVDKCQIVQVVPEHLDVQVISLFYLDQTLEAKRRLRLGVTKLRLFQNVHFKWETCIHTFLVEENLLILIHVYRL